MSEPTAPLPDDLALCEETSEQREYVPSSLFVIQHARFRYACRACQGNVTIADKPPQPIDQGLPGPGLLAQTITSKFSDHLPLYRFEDIYARHGVELSRATLCGGMARSAELLTPLYDLMVKRVLPSIVVHADDTTVPVLAPTLPKTRTGRFWVYVGDVWRTSAPALAHAALARIRQLYKIESAAGEFSAEDRRALRQRDSVPLLTAFGEWLTEQGRHVLPKSPLGQAIAYARSNWAAPGRYPEHGEMSIDNNLAERMLRAQAIGRKNWTFLGSDRGGRTAAVLYSLTGSRRHLDIDPFAYLDDVLRRLPSLPAGQLDELLPDVWPKSHPLGRRKTAA